MLINNDTFKLLQLLGRGGKYQYLWRDQEHPPLWFEVGQRIEIPRWDAVYFCVNPQKQKQEGFKRGGIQNVAAVNTLFSEFDMKYGWAIDQIHELQPQPSIIISSGGGWHCYWILEQPEKLTDENLQKYKEIQAGWVSYTGGDKAAKDLTRVLRLPGTINNKYSPAREVKFLSTEFDRVYSINELLAFIPTSIIKPEPMQIYQPPSQNSGSYWLQKALSKAKVGNRNNTGFWLACQLLDAGLSEDEAIPYMEEYVNQVPEGEVNNRYTINEALSSLKSAAGEPRRPPAKNISPILKLDNSEPMAIQSVGIIEEEPEEVKEKQEEVHERLAPPLPTGVMPDWVLMQGAGKFIDLYSDYARKISPMTPDSFHQSAALIMAATVIARRLKINMPYDVIYPNLFFLWVAQTTLFRKTTAMNIAKRILYRHFWELLAPQDFTVEALLSDMAGFSPPNLEKMSQIEKDRWLQSRDFSSQKTLLLDEFSGLLATAGKDYGGGLLESLIRFYDCDPDFKRTTRAQGLLVIRNSYMNFLGATTPTAISAHTTKKILWGNGFWPRFILLTPDEIPEEFINSEEEPEPPAISQELLKLNARLKRSKYPDPHPEISVGIDEDAYRVWYRYYKTLSFDLLRKVGVVNPILHGSYGRLPTQTLKAALIMSAMDWPNSEPAPKVELKHMVRAIVMAEEWRESVHRVIEKVEASDYDTFSQRILKVINRHLNRGASLRDIHLGMRDKSPIEIQNQLFQMTMENVVEMKRVKPQKGGRPTEKYFIVSE